MAAERNPLGEKEAALQEMQECLEKAFESDQFLVAFMVPERDAHVRCHFITWKFPAECFVKAIHEFTRWGAAEKRGIEGPVGMLLPEAELDLPPLPEFEDIVAQADPFEIPEESAEIKGNEEHAIPISEEKSVD